MHLNWAKSHFDGIDAFADQLEPSPPLEFVTSVDWLVQRTGMYESGANGCVDGLASNVDGLGASTMEK